MGKNKRIKFKILGEKEFRLIEVQPGRDDLNTFLLDATADSSNPYFLEGSVILVNGRVAMRNITLNDGDSVIIFPPLDGG